MANKVYTLNYASYCEDDKEVYVECLMVSEDEEKIKKSFENDFNVTIKEDFDMYDISELSITKTDSKFIVKDINDFKIITETITYKEIR